MLEKKVIVIMLALSELASDKFVILEKVEILDAAQGDSVSMTDMEEVMSYIKAEKLICIKYQDDEEYCMAITQKGIDTISDIKRKIAEKKEEQELIAKNKELLAKQQLEKLQSRKLIRRGKVLDQLPNNVDEEMADDYMPESLDELALVENVEVAPPLQVIAKSIGKVKVFLYGLFGGLIGGGISVTTAILVEMFLL